VENILGIGGVFLRARDPAALAAWYRANLGIAIEEEGGTYATLAAAEGDQTVWATFTADTDYFGRRDQQAMVNYRVRDLDAMLAQLRQAGAEVDDRIEEQPYGRFGWAADPEGNRFELWQPPAA
jgi:predicted enzyme related to lactoylglutathione lyase